MEINVSNYQKKIKISKKWVKKVAISVLKKTGIKGELSIILVDNKDIKKLNHKYRHKNRATDVLSFSQEKEEKVACPLFLLGDVVISVERAKSQAREYGHTFKDEMRILIRHGILHLLGYTHKQMGKNEGD